MSDKLHNALKKLAAQLGAEFNGGYVVCRRNRIAFSIKMYEGDDHLQPSRIRVSMPFSGGAKFDFFEERAFDKVMKFLKIQKDYNSGYRELDRALLLSTEDACLVQRLLDNKPIRIEFLAMLKVGVSRFVSDGEVLATEGLNVKTYEADVAYIERSMQFLQCLKTTIDEIDD